MVGDDEQPLAREIGLLTPGGSVVIADERVGVRFTAPGDEIERLNYGWSVLTCLPSAMCGPGAAGTGTLLRRETFLGYAREAGFSSIDTA